MCTRGGYATIDTSRLQRTAHLNCVVGVSHGCAAGPVSDTESGVGFITLSFSHCVPAGERGGPKRLGSRSPARPSPVVTLLFGQVVAGIAGSWVDGPVCLSACLHSRTQGELGILQCEIGCLDD